MVKEKESARAHTHTHPSTHTHTHTSIDLGDNRFTKTRAYSTEREVFDLPGVA